MFTERLESIKVREIVSKLRRLIITASNSERKIVAGVDRIARVSGNIVINALHSPDGISRVSFREPCVSLVYSIIESDVNWPTWFETRKIARLYSVSWITVIDIARKVGKISKERVKRLEEIPYRNRSAEYLFR